MDSISAHIEKIKIPSIKQDLILIHQKLLEINTDKSKSPGISFENKVNRLKSENPAEYERFRRSTIPLILETTKNINEFLDIASKSKVLLSGKIKNYLEESYMELESDIRIIQKYYFDRTTSFLK